jgi:hypothetical protein
MRSAAVVAVLIVASLFFAGFAGAEPRYLQKETVMGAMENFSKALGVQCSYCHLPKGGQEKEGQPQLSPEEQAQTRAHFQVARAMLVMTNFANKKGGDPATCNTCHQGKAQPGSK